LWILYILACGLYLFFSFYVGSLGIGGILFDFEFEIGVVKGIVASGLASFGVASCVLSRELLAEGWYIWEEVRGRHWWMGCVVLD